MLQHYSLSIALHCLTHVGNAECDVKCVISSVMGGDQHDEKHDSRCDLKHPGW